MFKKIIKKLNLGYCKAKFEGADMPEKSEDSKEEK